MRGFRVVILIVFCFIISYNVLAQDSTRVKKNKLERNFLQDNGHWTIEVPIWIPGFRGEYAYGDVELEGEDGPPPEIGHPIEKPGPGDIFKRLFKTSGSLNFFFMNRITYDNQKFYAQFDALSGTVGGSLFFRYNNSELVKAKFNTNLFRFYFGYALIDTWSESEKVNFRTHAYGGIRIHDVNVSSEINKIDAQLKIDPLWVEPIVGLRAELALKRWLFSITGDLGNFGLNNKSSYMINLYAYFRLSNLLSIKAGWTDWDIKHKDKVMNEELKLKVHLSGPSTSLTFYF